VPGAAAPDLSGEMVEEFRSCYQNKWYRRYVLFLLFLIATLQTTDRNIPAILLPKISPEFHMTDADAGMLNGAAFVLIYALATIPLARVADMCGRAELARHVIGRHSTQETRVHDVEPGRYCSPRCPARLEPRS